MEEQYSYLIDNMVKKLGELNITSKFLKYIRKRPLYQLFQSI